MTDNDSSSNNNINIVTSMADWDINGYTFLSPKVNQQKATSIGMIDNKTNRPIRVAWPAMQSWGISKFDPNALPGGGGSNGNNNSSSGGGAKDIEKDKYNISLQFPNNPTGEALVCLNKMKEFEKNLISRVADNVKNWWGDERTTQAALEYTFFPCLKYPKQKENKTKTDYSRPPTFRGKVPQDDTTGDFVLDLFDEDRNQIYPTDNSGEPVLRTPIELVPKLATAECVFQCVGIWQGGKGWGVTWKLLQAIVHPREVESIRGVCLLPYTKRQREDEHSTSAAHSTADSIPFPDKHAVSATVVTDNEDEIAAAAAAAKKQKIEEVKVPANGDADDDDAEDDDDGDVEE